MTRYLYRVVDGSGQGPYRGGSYETMARVYTEVGIDIGNGEDDARPGPPNDFLRNPPAELRERTWLAPTLDDVIGPDMGFLYGFATLAQARAWFGKPILKLDKEGFKLRVYRRADSPKVWDAGHQSVFLPPERHADLPLAALFQPAEVVAATVAPVLGS